ncbi:MAG: bifunctional DNA primase/polymerase [Candidatus Korobacteraceae bacterium]
MDVLAGKARCEPGTQMSFLDIALSCIARGWYVFPCWPRDKHPLIKGGEGWANASNDEAQVRAWWAKWPGANVAVACGLSGVAVVDTDTGLTCKEDFEAWRDRNKLPVTYAVRTGRRFSKQTGEPEYGVQCYYSGGIPDVGLFKLDGCAGQIKSLGGYVMAAGCIHPDSGERYEVLCDAPLAPTPDVVRALKSEQHTHTGKPGEKITENRNIHLHRIMSKWRNDGMTEDGLMVAGLQFNADNYAPPMDEEEVRRIAHNAAKYDVPEAEPIAVLGGSNTPAPESVAVAEKQARPIFPDDAWAGTVFGEFAEIVCRGNFMRKRLASESFRAITGAIAGDQVTCGIAGVRMREYHAIIANRQSGKSYGLDCATAFYAKPSSRCVFEPLLLLHSGQNSYRVSGIGAQRFLPGSSNSFVDELTREKKHKRGEDVDVVIGPMWKPTARLITIQGEAMALFSRLCSPDWTGQALSALVTDLYDSLDAEVAITKDRATPKIPVQLQYSMLLCTQPQIWRKYMASHMMDSGLFGRFYIVGSEYKPTKVLLPDYSNAELFQEHFGALRRDVFARLDYLRDHPLRMTIATAAKERLQEWENALPDDEDMDRDLSSRMGLHVWRAAMARAWGATAQRTEITVEDADAAIRLGEYQVKMRQYYAPTPGDSPKWRHLNAVKAAIEQAGQISLRDLRRTVRGDRFPEDFDWSLAYLEKRGRIVARKEGRAQIVCWTLDTN